MLSVQLIVLGKVEGRSRHSRVREPLNELRGERFNTSETEPSVHSKLRVPKLRLIGTKAKHKKKQYPYTGWVKKKRPVFEHPQILQF